MIKFHSLFLPLRSHEIFAYAISGAPETLSRKGQGRAIHFLCWNLKSQSELCHPLSFALRDPPLLDLDFAEGIPSTA